MEWTNKKYSLILRENTSGIDDKYQCDLFKLSGTKKRLKSNLVLQFNVTNDMKRIIEKEKKYFLHETINKIIEHLKLLK